MTWVYYVAESLDNAKCKQVVSWKTLQEARKEYSHQAEILRLLEQELNYIAREKDSTYLSLVNAEQNILKLEERRSVLEQEDRAATEDILNNYINKRKELRARLFKN